MFISLYLVCIWIFSSSYFLLRIKCYFFLRCISHFSFNWKSSFMISLTLKFLICIYIILNHGLSLSIHPLTHWLLLSTHIEFLNKDARDCGNWSSRWLSWRRRCKSRPRWWSSRNPLISKSANWMWRYRFGKIFFRIWEYFACVC